MGNVSHGAAEEDNQTTLAARLEQLQRQLATKTSEMEALAAQNGDLVAQNQDLKKKLSEVAAHNNVLRATSTKAPKLAPLREYL